MRITEKEPERVINVPAPQKAPVEEPKRETSPSVRPIRPIQLPERKRAA